MTYKRKVQCPRVGLEVKIYDTPAGGIHASQGTFLVDIMKRCEYSRSMSFLDLGPRSFTYEN